MIACAKHRSCLLLYPYTPDLIGVSEERVALIHDNAVHSWLRQMKSKGFDVEVVYFTRCNSQFAISVMGLPVRFFPISKWLGNPERFAFQWSLSFLLYLFKAKPDALVIWGTWISSGNAIALVRAATCRRYSVIAGGWGMPRGRISAQFLKGAYRVFVHTSLHKIHLVSGHGIHPRQIDVLPIGVDLNEFAPGAAETSYAYPHLLYVGRVVSSKGIWTLLKALPLVRREFPRSSLTLVGPISDDFRAELLEYSYAHGFNADLRMPGQVLRTQLPAFFRSADLFVFPSESESFGMALVEAMACGIPAIAMCGSNGPDEIVKDGETGWLVEPRLLPDALVRVLQDPPTLHKVGEHARIDVVHRFSAEQTFQRLDKLLKDMTADGH
jgi:glycosyltransferase involved in cell wall biosynthesis